MRLKKILSTIIIIIILQTLIFNLVPVRAQGNFTFVNSLWGSTSNPQKVYPGSSNVNLILFIRNDSNQSLVSVSITLYLPHGIESYDGKSNITSNGYVQENNSIKYTVSPGEIFQANFILNILDYAEAKEYNCTALIEYYTSSLTVGKESITVWFTVSPFPAYSFKFIESYWTTSAGYRVNGSSGARNLNLNVVLKNIGESSINSVSAKLNLDGNFYPQTSTSSASNVGMGEVFTLAFTQVSIPVSTAPGTYILNLELNCTFIGYGNAVNMTSYTIQVPVDVFSPSSPNLRLVRVAWRNYEKAYPGARAIILEATIQNFGEYTVSESLIKLYLPRGFTDTFGKNIVNSTSSATIGYGEFATYSIGPIYVSSNVAPGIYYGNATLECVGSRDSSQLLLVQNISIPLIVSRYISNFDVSSVEWLYGGQPAVALPGAQDVQLSIVLVNRGEETFSGLTASPSLPSGFKLLGEDVYSGTVPSGASFTISFHFNISENVKPGNYIIPVSLTFNLNPSSSNTISSSGIMVPVWVEDPVRFDSELKVVNVFWGSYGNPSTVYPGSKLAPLTVEVVNVGLYTVHGARLKLYTSEAFEAVVGEAELSTSLPPGSFSTSTFYLNVNFDAPPGRYNLTLQENYFITLYGAQISKARNLTVEVRVFEPSVRPPYVKVISCGWGNGYPVYPGTENATFNVVISNQAPYSISGIYVTLEPYKFFRESGFQGLKAYVSGPLAPWQTTTLSFKLNVDHNAVPGDYHANLTLEYTLLSGGNNLRVRDVQPVSIKINMLNPPEHVYSSWVRYSPGPGNKGALLLLVFRNNEVPVMRGTYVMITLPKGFKSTVTGSERVNVTPSSFSSATQLQDILSLFSGQPQVPAQAPQAQIGRGDLIAVPVQVDVDRDTLLGGYNLTAEFNFVDQWGCVQKAFSRAYFTLLGSTNMVEVVEGKSKLFIGLRSAVIELFVKNNGTAPLRDVYVAIGGAPQGIAVSSSVKYVPEIGPGGEVNLTWLASVNPQTPYTGSLPILVVISFADQLGYRRTFNQTAIVYVEGIVELKLMDTSLSPEPVYAGETLTVSTTILNLGTYKAKNVEASVAGSFLENITGSYTFVGDVDVGAQVPVSLQARVKDVVGERILYLIIRYRNVFNEPITQVYPLNVTVYSKPATTTTSAIPIVKFIDTYRVVFIILILGFLVASGILIYKLYQRAKKAAV
jgi:hypothetical protein